jgi:hypothetical protein
MSGVRTRELHPGEKATPTVMGAGPDAFYFSVINAPVPQPSRPFPEQPTFTILREIVKNGSINDAPNTYIDFADDGVDISYIGHVILRYFSNDEYPEGLTFFAQQAGVALPIGWYQKYLGKTFTVSMQDGLLGLASKHLSWRPIVGGMKIDVLTGKTNQQSDLVMYKNRLARAFLKDYLDRITPDSLAQLSVSNKPGLNSLLTKCPGCRKQDIDHLEVHLQRGELTPFLIFAVFDFLVGNADQNAQALLTHMKSNDSVKDKIVLCDMFRDLASRFFRIFLTHNFAIEMTTPYHNGVNLLSWSHNRNRDKYPPVFNSGGTINHFAGDAATLDQVIGTTLTWAQPIFHENPNVPETLNENFVYHEFSSDDPEDHST